MSIQKKHTGRRQWAVLLILLMAWMLLLPHHVLAAEKLHPDQEVTLTVVCRDDNQPIQGLSLHLYRVADVTENVEFTLTEDFKESGVSLNQMNADTWKAAADILADFVKSHPDLKPVGSDTTDAEGKVYFPSKPTVMKAGLYLLMGEQIQLGESVYTPGHSLVCLPEQDTEGQWQYDAVVYPKMDKTGTVVDRKVMKIWKDEGNISKRPDKIEVNLMHDGNLYETVTLSAENQWQYTWKNLSGMGEWTVEEKNIPSGYTAEVQADGTGFVITNTYIPPTTPPTTPPATPPHLPQTGVLWWPVPLLAVAGVLLFLLGWLRRQKNGEANENR